jgi:hypothetical protein
MSDEEEVREMANSEGEMLPVHPAPALAYEAVEKDGEIVAKTVPALPLQAANGKYVVVHVKTYATRVRADGIGQAEKLVGKAFPDTRILDSMPDHGEATHGLGGAELSVEELED